jgi:tRNA-Thr(GGU) m(6)t(6)A37 methyltransferase TsaA
MSIIYRPIGVIRSEHTAPEKTPIQPAYAKGCKGRAEILPEFADGLLDLEGFSHIYLVYHMHKAGPAKLMVKPFIQDVERGVFAARAPCRPNPIGLSIVELVRREGNVLHLDGLDVLDGTPLLDIKPYTAKFDRIETTRNGWQDEVDSATARERGRRGHRPADAAEDKDLAETIRLPLGLGVGTGRGRGRGEARSGASDGRGQGAGRRGGAGRPGPRGGRAGQGSRREAGRLAKAGG